MANLISRQAVIEAMAELQGRASTKAELKGISKAWKRIKQLPSAQSEIIRCKDCIYFDQSGWCDYLETSMGMNDFCSRAKRRTDEQID